jgi:hypothetical protein
MIKTLLKCLALAVVFTFTTVTEAQIYQKFPTNVRYIGGGYNNVRPFFKTLEAALNDVKPLATSSNPYVFWLASDSLWVSDWDSVFTESGLTMKDSVDIYYVAEGKIKWMPFSTGGDGGATVSAPDDITLHYYWPTWDQTNMALQLWQRMIGTALDSVDEEVFRLIVYTADPLYIENDTLKLDVSGLGGTTGWDPDTTTVVRTTGNQTIAGDKTLSGTTTSTGTIAFSGSGNIQLPALNGSVGTPRRLWGTTTNIYYSGSGSADDSTEVVLIDFDTKYAVQDTFITPGNLALEAKEYFVKGGTATFSGAYSSMNIVVSGISSTSYIVATPIQSDSSTAVSALDDIRVIPYNGGFYLKRQLGGTSNLKVNWAWIKR